MQDATNKFSTMSKTELRDACKQYGVKNYGKMNNDGMRAALVEKEGVTRVTLTESTDAKNARLEKAARDGASQVLSDEIGNENPTDADIDASNTEPVYPARSPFADMIAPPSAPAAVKGATVVRDGKKVDATVQAPVDKTEKLEGYLHTNVHKCPKCGKEEDQTWANEGVSLFCHGCSTTYSASTGKEIRTGYTRENVSKGYNIEKDRPKQNGVTRPSSGTVCGQVWAAFDANPSIAAKDLPALALTKGWNKNNVSCEFYVWRKFNGITGRSAK